MKNIPHYSDDITFRLECNSMETQVSSELWEKCHSQMCFYLQLKFPASCGRRGGAAGVVDVQVIHRGATGEPAEGALLQARAQTAGNSLQKKKERGGK